MENRVLKIENGCHPIIKQRKMRRTIYALIGFMVTMYFIYMFWILEHFFQISDGNEQPGTSDEHQDVDMDEWFKEDEFGGVLNSVHACTEPKFRTQGPVTALSSFPGSGDDWIAKLVEQSTGFLTGSLYSADKEENISSEAIANGSFILIKTHEWGKQSREQYERAVLVIRDPYEVLLEGFLKSRGHDGYTSPEIFRKRKEWNHYVENAGKLWMEHILDWLKFDRPLLTLSYQVMKEALPKQLPLLLNFLGVNITSSFLQCAIHNVHDPHSRHLKMLHVLDPFSSSLKTQIERYKKIVGMALAYRELSLPFDSRYREIKLK